VTASSSPSSGKGGRLASRLIAGGTVLAAFSALAWADATAAAEAPPMAWLLPALIVVAAGAGREAARMSAATLALPTTLVAVGAAAIAAAPAIHAWYRGQSEPLSLVGAAGVACMGVITAAFIAGVIHYAAGRGEAARIAGSIAASISIGLPLAFMVALRLEPLAGPTGPLVSLVPLVSLIAVVKAGDVAAYAVGSAVGRHRMAPSLSPGKTWEGAAASLLASLAAAWLVIERLGGFTASRPLGGWVVYGLLVGIAGMIGDLAESLVKRDLATKDSGHLLGGMGGFLDLIDSLLLAAPVAWLLWAAG
jgi:phosphatidate cytidylyltransferase